MGTVGIRELKQNASKVVARAKAGEPVTITDRGQPVAVLVPIHKSRIDVLVDAGLATSPTRSLRDLPPPAPRAEGQAPLSQIVNEQRADRL